MAILVNIGEKPDITVTVKETEKIKLKASKTLAGNVLVEDHPDMDIVISPEGRKIITFPKEKKTDKVYDVQDRFFEFLAKQGVIQRESIHSGAAYGSIEAKYAKPKDESVSAVQVALLAISKFIDEESDYFDVGEEFEKEFEKSLTDPELEDSTELGEVPHADQKGAIRQGYIYSPYGISSIYRYE